MHEPVRPAAPVDRQDRVVAEVYLFLAAAFTVIRTLRTPRETTTHETPQLPADAFGDQGRSVLASCLWSWKHEFQRVSVLCLHVIGSLSMSPCRDGAAVWLPAQAETQCSMGKARLAVLVRQ